MNVGEQLVADYLQHVEECQFVGQNLPTSGEQGEIDVIGVDIENKKIYMCEVAIHLETGLQYTKDRHPNNINKFIEKFRRCSNYANDYWKGYTHIYMLWSPIVKSPQKSSAHSQVKDVEEIVSQLEQENIKVTPIINQDFMKCIEELKNHAANTTTELKSPIMRYMQLESKLERHINKKIAPSI